MVEPGLNFGYIAVKEGTTQEGSHAAQTQTQG
jgi:hypothetical protein